MSHPNDPSAPTKDNPYTSKLLVNRLLTEGSDKETRHFELCLSGSGLSYEPGDSLGVIPQNDPKVVADLLAAVGLSGAEEVLVGENKLSLQDALTNQLACTVLSKIQVKKFPGISSGWDFCRYFGWVIETDAPAVVFHRLEYQGPCGTGSSDGRNCSL